MSLLRLLTAGKSLMGAKSPPGWYRFSDPRSMPKFRSTVNPFKAKTVAEGTEAGRRTDGDEAKAEEVQGTVGAEPPGLKSRTSYSPAEAIRTVAEAVLATAEPGDSGDEVMEAAPVEPALAEGISKPNPATPNVSAPVKNEPIPVNKIEQRRAVVREQVGKWISKLSSLTNSWRLRKRSSAPAERKPIQGELTLENIKVVRNDLSESDLEVVAAGSAQANKKAARRNDRAEVADVESVVGATRE